MTMEDNKLIAEFMGYVYDDDRFFMEDSEGVRLYENLPHELQYHTSWDWLMPVVRQVLTSIDIDWIHYDDDELKFNVLDCDISGVHKEVVEFIKKYRNE